MADRLQEKYQALLHQYLEKQKEDQLFAAQQLSKIFIEQNVGLTEVIATHWEVLEKKVALPPIWKEAYRFLVEFLAYYDLSMKERNELLLSQKQYEAELSLAASVQQSLLLDISILQFPPDVEAGVSTVAARKVSGDFHYFAATPDSVQFTIADIAGKSIPAALSMSMIRFAMDEMIHYGLAPHALLELMNRFVYNNTEISTFVTMFCGAYHPASSTFQYASAGHEPALLYRSAIDRFVELNTDGCALGITKHYKFEAKSVELFPGDIMLLYTDGVVENRESDEADNNLVLQTLLRELDLSLPAQQLVNQLHQLLLGRNAMEIHDDQTLLLCKKKS